MAPQEYVYDRYGNRTIHQTNTYGTGVNKKDFTVNTANNRLGVPSGQSGTMTYDNAGNLTIDTYSGAAELRAYDAENRMTKETQSNSVVAGEYTYNADGQRVRRKVGGVETWQVYGLDGELLAEYAANGTATTPQKEYGYRNGQLLITADAPTDSGARINVAVAANGGAATASSVYSSNPLEAANTTNNGDRKGGSTNGSWNDAAPANSFPDWLQVDFNGSKTIDEIDVFTVQDNWQSPSDPTEALSFSLYGLTGYDVQYWNAATSAWVTVTGGSITSNNKVWKKLTFSPITTSKIRVLTNTSPDGYSRITEVEAWTPRTNVALSANGGTASASSVYSSCNCAAATTNNGDRKGDGSNGSWNDAAPANSFPDWLQVDFNGSKTIDEIDVYTVQDNWQSPSDPTEALTFSLYGLTGYDVQYWNAATSAWVTVSGGSVTGNNKVWRKINFSPVTTTQIRVLTNASVDGYSRITEVEAWTAASGGSATANLNWLVTDQLGTPRMVFDKSGSLATTKRHDYAPFGEELFNGLRPNVPGYAVDSTRQKFTSKERDIETGLDYFGARYFTSTQGRFTSVDPVAIKLKHLVNPQDLDRYAFVGNNPLAFLDPDGKEKIRITVRSFIPDSTKWGYAGDRHRTGEKIGAKDGYRIRESIVVETDPSRNNGNIIVAGSPRYEVGLSIGPNLYNPSRFGMLDVDQAKCARCSMTAVRTEEKGVSVNFTADVSNPLHPGLAASINLNLNVTANPTSQNNIVASVDGEHTKFPAFDVTMERLDQPNSSPVVVYGYDPYVNPFNNGSSPFSLTPLAPKQQVTEPETATTIPQKKP